MLSPTMQGKRITVYVNGDRFMPGKVVTLNTHQIPEFDTFCQYLTERVPNRTGGCYRRIYTPNGSEVRDLNDIQAGHEYVVSKDRYRKVAKEYNYKEIPERQRLPRHKGFKKIDISRIYTPVQHALEERLRKKSGRSYYLNEHRRGLRLRVHVNGQSERPFCPVSIRYKDKDNWFKILEEIERTLNLQPVEKVYRIINQGGYAENFTEINSPDGLESDEHILVLPKNDRHLHVKFYSLEGKNNFKVRTSPRAGQYYLYPSFPEEKNHQYKHNKSLNKHRPLPSIGSSGKQSEAMSPYSNPPQSQGGRSKNSSVKNRGAKQVDYDRDQGGVYRSKQQNNARGAQQEDFRNEKSTPIPPGTELNKQPSKEKKDEGGAENSGQTKSKEDRSAEEAGQK